MNKKAQGLTGFIAFAAVIIALLVMSPFMLKIFNSGFRPLSAAFGNQSAEAGAATGYVINTTVSWWDSLVLFLFLAALIILLVSSFLVDVSPFFIGVYVVVAIFFFAIAPSISPLLYQIYENQNFTTEVAQIPALGFIVEYFWLIILGVYIFSGIIMFVKIRFFPSGGGGY